MFNDRGRWDWWLFWHRGVEPFVGRWWWVLLILGVVVLPLTFRAAGIGGRGSADNAPSYRADCISVRVDC